MNQLPPLLTRNYLLAFVGNFLLFFSFYLLLPLLPIYLLDVYSAGKTEVGVVLSIYTLSALCVRPFAGFLVDYFQRKPLLLLTYIFFVGSFVGYLVAGTLLMFAVIRAIHGVSFGLVTTSQSTVVIDVIHPERRNEGIGYYGISTNISMAISPMLSMFLFEKYDSYDLVFMMAIAIGLVGLLVVSMLHLKPREQVVHTPISLDRFVVKGGFGYMFSLILMSFGYGSVMSYVAVYAIQEIGLTSGTGFYFLGGAIGLILSRFASSRAMREGRLTYLITVGAIVAFAGIFMLTFFKNMPCFYLSSVLFGFGYGFIGPPMQAIFVGMVPHNRRGTANSTYFTSFDLGLGMGTLVGGKIASMSNYTMTYVVSILLLIIGIAFFRLVIRSARKKAEQS